MCWKTVHRDLEAPIMERKPVHSDILQPPPSSRRSRLAAMEMAVPSSLTMMNGQHCFGMNSRLDTIQAAVLQVKLKAFKEYELTDVNRVAARYTEALADCVKVPQIPEGYTSSWASYNILFKDEAQRDEVRAYLQENGIPTMIYYPKGLHQQKVFENCCLYGETLPVTTSICRRTLAIPVSPYLAEEDQDKIIRLIREKTGV